MAYLSFKYLRKKRQNLGNLGTFNDEPQFFFLFLKVVIDAIKTSMTFLLFAFFLHEYSPKKSPPKP